MSTKINARSPFYIEAVAPTPTLGAFTCDVASLTDFSVAPDGTITEPNILRGTIIDRDQTSFAALSAGDASVSRTVNYTIQIPDGYSNTNDGTISCPQTFTQVAPAAVCDSATNTNMATFSGTIGNITNLNTTAQTVSLGSFFTQQAGATFKEYEIVRIGSSAIDFTLSGSGASQTLSFTTTSTGVDASFRVIAHNNGDSCTTTSNSFTVTAAATGDLDCDDLNLTGGSITQGGAITVPSYSAVGDLYKIYVGAVDYTSTDYPDNTNTTERTVTLKLYFRVPSSYGNATPAGSTDLNDYLLCTKDVQQAGTSLSALACTDDIISYTGFRISTTGDIVISDAQVTVDGTAATIKSVTGSNGELTFPEVSTKTSRTLDVTFTIPSGYSNTGDLTCEDAVTVQQPPRDIAVSACDIGVEKYITQGKKRPAEFCDYGYVYSARRAISVSDTGLSIGTTVCDGRQPFNGFGYYYAITDNVTSSAAGAIGATFRLYQIDQFGTILSVVDRNCQSDAEFDEAL